MQVNNNHAILTTRQKKRLERNSDICKEYVRLKNEYKGASFNRLCMKLAEAFDLTPCMIKNIVTEARVK